MSTYNNQAAESMHPVPNVRRPSQGSSTGAPGFPTGLQDTQSQYNPAMTGVNPSTGAGYQKPPPVPARPSNSYDQGGYDAPTQQAYDAPTQHAYNAPTQHAYDAPTQHASTAQHTNLDDRATAHTGTKVPPSERYAQKGDDIGRKAQGVMAGVHGAGESLRGALTGAVDRAFGTTEGPRGAERNEEIARRGEREIQTGEFTRSGR
ncbi:hypothetical protein N7476_000957 [Penicillium atrosanguineum]|uniref:Uncharacterized protein n=1 Tax=Penicillium atrosanguineum TaxID=1132637 RepID=A0A9W9UD79_9EURO|nr:hypothetical protein N7476_000957 [Penicillium atrosanguineum]